MSLRNVYDTERLEGKLQDAIIIGHTTETTSKVWVRSKYQGLHFVVLSQNPLTPEEVVISNGHVAEELNAQLGTDVIINAVNLSFDNDNTEVVLFKELKPGRTYYVGLVADSTTKSRKQWRSGFEIPAKFKTSCAKQQTLTFGFFSCHDPFKKGSGSNEIFDDMKQRLDDIGADFVIAGGDQVYVDSSVKKDDLWEWVIENKEKLKPYYPNKGKALVDELCHFYRYIYRKYWASKELLTLFRSFPIYMIWDDHEIMDGWGSLDNDELSDKLDTLFEWEDKEFNLFLAGAMFQAAKRTYFEFQHNHNPDTKKDQWDYHFDNEVAGIFALDMRGHHQYKSASGFDLLGEDQFGRFSKWVEKQAKQKKVLFIVSPVPVLHWSSTIVNMADIGGAKDDFRDEWDHEANSTERNKLLDTVFSASQQNEIPIVFLSGDVHSAATFKLSRRKYPKAQIYQFTSSGVTRAPAPFISKMISREKGVLKCESEGVKTHFKRESFITRNNFGVISVDIVDGKARVVGEHVSTTDEEFEVIIKKVWLSKR